MEPSLHKNDVLLVIHTKFSAPKRNNIILIKKDGKTIVKRIYRVTGHGIDVRGDNTEYSYDSRIFGLVKSEDVLGKVINKICSHV